jgi:uncharacterized protein
MRPVAVPSDEEIRSLHKEHAPDGAAFDSVYTHCRIVCEIAEQLYDRSGVGGDIDLVRAGCLLHDIGVYRLYDAGGVLDHANYIRHGILGQELLRKAGYPEEICRFAAHHTGVGLTSDDVLRQELPLPPGDYLAESEEERLVMYADKFHSKSTPPRFLTADAYAARVRRFGDDKLAAFQALRAAFGEPGLAPLQANHGHRVRGVSSAPSAVI